ncbi:hypothetical protein [Saccharomonospora piscinae]|uniref:hypothetical protein n=1 Tax=Saccharomonospora piscinae TaxID=687388 RepID=UPI0004B4A91D
MATVSAASGASAAKAAKVAAGVCAALALGACGTSPAGAGPDEATPGPLGTPAAAATGTAPPPQPSAAATSPAAGLRFGSEHRFPSGLSVSVSSPNIFQPSENAYPRSDRAAAFDIKVYNDGQKPYRLSDLSVRASIEDVEVQQVQDATRGYNGVVDADRDIPPGETVGVTLAFAAHPEPAALRLTLRPDSSDETKAVFVGTV